MQTIFTHEILGHPVRIRVTRFVNQKPMPMHSAPSDMDYYGYTEVEYEIWDAKGTEQMHELERQLNEMPDLREQIDEEVISYMLELSEDLRY